MADDDIDGRNGFELRVLGRHRRMLDEDDEERGGGRGRGGRERGSYGGDELEDDYGDEDDATTKNNSNHNIGINNDNGGFDANEGGSDESLGGGRGEGVSRENSESELDERLSRPFLSHWRLLGISLYWLGNNIIWTALSMFLLQDQVKRIVEEDDKGSGLALIIIVGGSLSLVTFPLFGAISDSDQFWFQKRWGKRKPFLSVGVLGMTIGLLGMALFTTKETFWLYILSYLVLKLFSDLASAPFSAIIPDVVNPKQYGVASGYWGLNSIIGSVIGGLFGLIVEYGMFFNCMLLLVLNVIGTVFTLWFTPPDDPDRHKHSLEIDDNDALKEMLSRTQRFRRALRSFFIFVKTWTIRLLEPLKDENFRLVFSTRFVWTSGTAIIQTYLVYFFQDVMERPFILFGLIEFDDYNDASSVFIILVLVGCLISSVISGVCSDRFGRKGVVIISGFFQALACVIIMIWPNLNVGAVSGFMFGIGYGAYQAVDWALASDVLPSKNDNAKDLGVWQISQILPNVVASPLAGVLLDKFQRLGQNHGIPNLGYTVIYSSSTVLVFLGCLLIYLLKLPTLTKNSDSDAIELNDIQESTSNSSPTLSKKIEEDL